MKTKKRKAKKAPPRPARYVCMAQMPPFGEFRMMETEFPCPFMRQAVVMRNGAVVTFSFATVEPQEIKGNVILYELTGVSV